MVKTFESTGYWCFSHASMTFLVIVYKTQLTLPTHAQLECCIRVCLSRTSPVTLQQRTVVDTHLWPVIHLNLINWFTSKSGSGNNYRKKQFQKSKFLHAALLIKCLQRPLQFFFKPSTVFSLILCCATSWHLCVFTFPQLQAFISLGTCGSCTYWRVVIRWRSTSITPQTAQSRFGWRAPFKCLPAHAIVLVLTYKSWIDPNSTLIRFCR